MALEGGTAYPVIFLLPIELHCVIVAGRGQQLGGGGYSMGLDSPEVAAVPTSLLARTGQP